jgi:hypothetical protein
MVVACGYMIFYFFVFAGMVGVALFKATVGLCKLIAVSWKALLRKADQKALQRAPEDSKPPIKAQPGPRDYHLPD